MSFIQNIKTQISERIIKRKLRKNPRKKEFYDLENAESIGIFFDTLDDNNFPVVKKFSNDLISKGFKVESVGWINANELPDFGVAQKTLFYTNKDIKWTGEPIMPELLEFINKRFDLLFVLTSSSHHSVRYIANLSKASCKVGASLENLDYLDFIIAQRKNKSVECLIEESLNFLTQIRKL